MGVSVVHKTYSARTETAWPEESPYEPPSDWLVLLALLVATVGALAAPGVAIADPIGDKQAEAAQLDSQINANANKLGALNEQINSAENALARATNDIQQADALVTAAKNRTKELRAEVARSRRHRLHAERHERRHRGPRLAERAGPVLEAEVQLARRMRRQRIVNELA